jgi:crotonobetainyl-CoA:carnitine CoA-transferase CaiB-like acyl-CoA transferase
MRIRGRRPFATRDGHVCILAYTDRHWRALFPLFGLPELIADPRFVNSVERQKNMTQLYDLIEENIAHMSTDECLAALAKADVPCGRVNRIDEVLTDPQSQAVGLVVDIDHPSEGRIRNIRPPVNFSDSPASIRFGAPRQGEHTRAVLREAGYSDDEIDAALASGAAKEA